MPRRSEVVSVVVPTRNRGATLGETIRTILSADPRPLEVIVVDQSDPMLAAAARSHLEAVASEFGLKTRIEGDRLSPGAGSVADCDVRYVASDLRGAGSGRNTGARAAHGEIVLYTDDDTSVEPNWIAAVEREFLDAQVVGVYGRVLAPHSRRNQRNRGGGTEVKREGGRAVYTTPTMPWYLGTGANMAFRRRALLAQGGFDEVLTIGGPFRSFEDLDVGHRLLSSGAGGIVFCPESVVYHESPKAFAEQLRTEQGYGVGAGAAFVKYLRCGDALAWSIIRRWFWNMAVRRAAAGVLKWHSVRVIRLALVQFWAPFVGIVRAARWPVDRQQWVFRPRPQR